MREVTGRRKNSAERIQELPIRGGIARRARAPRAPRGARSRALSRWRGSRSPRGAGGAWTFNSIAEAIPAGGVPAAARRPEVRALSNRRLRPYPSVPLEGEWRGSQGVDFQIHSQDFFPRRTFALPAGVFPHFSPGSEPWALSIPRLRLLGRGRHQVLLGGPAPASRRTRGRSSRCLHFQIDARAPSQSIQSARKNVVRRPGSSRTEPWSGFAPGRGSRPATQSRPLLLGRTGPGGPSGTARYSVLEEARRLASFPTEWPPPRGGARPFHWPRPRCLRFHGKDRTSGGILPHPTILLSASHPLLPASWSILHAINHCLVTIGPVFCHFLCRSTATFFTLTVSPGLREVPGYLESLHSTSGSGVSSTKSSADTTRLFGS